MIENKPLTELMRSIAGMDRRTGELTVGDRAARREAARDHADRTSQAVMQHLERWCGFLEAVGMVTSQEERVRLLDAARRYSRDHKALEAEAAKAWDLWRESCDE